MEQLENLLNVLLKNGWKPWGENIQKVTIKSSEIFVYNFGGFANPNGKHIRELVSLESGLWQFVCSNKLQNQKHSEDFNGLGIKLYNEGCDARVGASSQLYEYRLLESALIPEEELGKFLVDNIVINE